MVAPYSSSAPRSGFIAGAVMLVLLLVLVLSACASNSPSIAASHVEDAAATVVRAAEKDAARAPANASDASDANDATSGGPPAGEAARTKVASFERDPLLAPHAALLRAHFGADIKARYVMQRADLARGRVALLVSLADESNPMVLVIDRGEIEWVKERPTAGILPPVPHLALSAHPEGGVVLFAFVPSVHLVAARVWTEEGAPFADMEVLPLDACDALSAAYWPELGWIVGGARRGGTRGELVRENGTPAWGRDGIEIGASWREAAPVSIVIDGKAGAFVVQHASGRAGKDHLVALRYDAKGRAVWAVPLDIGEVSRVTNPADRAAASLVHEGVVRVELARGVLARTASAVEIDGAGALHWIAR
jgi:hypothetical protein